MSAITYQTADGNQAPSRHDVLPTHAAAELFEPLPDDELNSFTETIIANGIAALVPVIIYVDDDGQEFLLDGRNRLDALQLAGIVDLTKHGRFNSAEIPHQRVAGVDPVALATSLNTRRRNLTREAKHAVIGKLLKMRPGISDHQVATCVGVSHNTVKAVRAELVGRCQIDNVETRVDSKGRRQPAKKPRKTGKPTVPAEANMPAVAGPPIMPALPGEAVECHTKPASTPKESGAELADTVRAAAALNRFDPRAIPLFFGALLPATRQALERLVLGPDKLAHSEIATLVGECNALLNRPQQHVDAIRRRLARIKKIAGPREKTRVAPKSNARLDPNLLGRALGLSGRA